MGFGASDGSGVTLDDDSRDELLDRDFRCFECALNVVLDLVRDLRCLLERDCRFLDCERDCDRDCERETEFLRCLRFRERDCDRDCELDCDSDSVTDCELDCELDCDSDSVTDCEGDRDRDCERDCDRDCERDFKLLRDRCFVERDSVRVFELLLLVDEC